jgi:hypothetical protein
MHAVSQSWGEPTHYNEGNAFHSLVRRCRHVHKHHEHVLDAWHSAHTVEQAWRAAVPTDSRELVTRWSAGAMLSVICATDGQPRGTPSPLACPPSPTRPQAPRARTRRVLRRAGRGTSVESSSSNRTDSQELVLTRWLRRPCSASFVQQMDRLRTCRRSMHVVWRFRA